MNPPKFYSAQEASEISGLPLRSVQRRAATRGIGVKCGNGYVFYAQDIEELMKPGKHHSFAVGNTEWRKRRPYSEWATRKKTVSPQEPAEDEPSITGNSRNSDRDQYSEADEGD